MKRQKNTSGPFDARFLLKRVRSTLTGKPLPTSETAMPKWKELYNEKLECSLEYFPSPEDYTYRNIISLSLFRPRSAAGAGGARYIAGARQFVMHMRRAYPGWGLRIYFDASLAEDPDPEFLSFIEDVKPVGDDILEGEAYDHIQLVKFFCPAFRDPENPHYHQHLFSAMSRFLAWFDPNVDVVAFRDIDWTPNFEDYLILEDFVESEKPIGYYKLYSRPFGWLNCIEPWREGYPPIAAGSWMAKRAKYNYWPLILELATSPSILECLDSMSSTDKQGRGYGTDEVTLNIVLQNVYKPEDFVPYNAFEFFTANMRTVGGDEFLALQSGSSPRFHSKEATWDDFIYCGKVKEIVEEFLVSDKIELTQSYVWDIVKILLFCRANVHWNSLIHLIDDLAKENGKPEAVGLLSTVLSGFENLGIVQTLNNFADEYIRSKNVLAMKNVLSVVYLLIYNERLVVEKLVVVAKKLEKELGKEHVNLVKNAIDYDIDQIEKNTVERPSPPPPSTTKSRTIVRVKRKSK